MPVRAQGPAAAAGPWLLDAEQRLAVRLCVSTLAALSTVSLVGVAFSLYLVNHYPLLLVAMSPIGRHLLLAAPNVDPLAFVAVVVARRMLFYIASFQLGRTLGPAGIDWIERRAARFGRFVRWLEQVFARAAYPIVFCFAGPTISAIAGASGMRLRVFAALAAPGLALRALGAIALAAWARGYIEIALEWIDEHWLPGTILMVALVVLYRWRRSAPTRLMED